MQGVLVILVVWLVWYMVRTVMGMFKNELKQLHQDSLKNAELNKEGITLIKESRKESSLEHGKITKALNTFTNFHNGKNPAIQDHDERLKKLEGK